MKPVRILIVWPRHELDGKILMGMRSRFATHGHDLGECFIVQTKWGRFAIPVKQARVLKKAPKPPAKAKS